jgi:hypothetical protein
MYSTNHTSNPPPTSAFPAPAQQNTTKMASDEDYAAFLEKANADPNEGYVKTQSAGKGSGTAHLRAVDEGEEVPAGLREAVQDQVYVSDADEPFEGVCLRMKDGDEELPDEGPFCLLYICIAIFFAQQLQPFPLLPPVLPLVSPPNKQTQKRSPSS